MLKKNVYPILIMMLLSLILNFNVQISRSSPEPTISIEPRQTKKLSVDETFTVNVTVKDCQNVYAVQVDIRYDPYILDAIEIIEGPFLKSAGNTLVLFNESRVNEEAEPPYGQVYFVATLWGDVPGASGDGVLFTITFQVLDVGSSHLNFYAYPPHSGSGDGTYFMDSDYNEIYPTLEDGFYGTPITLSVQPSKISIGGNVTISGQVLGVEEAVNVILYYRKEGGGWNELVTKQTNSTGHFDYLWKPPDVGKYYFKAATVVEGVHVESAEALLTVESVGGLDVILIIAIVVVVVVVVAVAAVALKRRRKP
jgi:hypothetical protein